MNFLGKLEVKKMDNNMEEYFYVTENYTGKSEININIVINVRKKPGGSINLFYQYLQN